jgi:hypothetical protein
MNPYPGSTIFRIAAMRSYLTVVIDSNLASPIQVFAQYGYWGGDAG